MANVVIATSNAHKVEEYKALMADDSIELQSLLDYPGFPDVEENGTTFTENASIKAIAASKYCDAPAFADDSGLEVFALNGEPGIYSARYAPTDPERIAKLLKNLEGKETVVDELRGAEAAREVIRKCRDAYIEKFCR